MKLLWLGLEDDYTPVRAHAAAQTLGIELTTLDIVDLSFVAADGVVGVFHQGTDLVANYDALIARMFYPHISEMLTVARLFRDAGKTVVDQSLNEEGFVVSKMHDYLVLAQHGVDVPRTWQIVNSHDIEMQAKLLGYPCILKGVHGSHGIHVHMVQDVDDLRRRVSDYAPGELLLQEYLPAVQDYRLMVIGYKAVPWMVSRIPAEGDFRTNVGLSHTAQSHRLENYEGIGPLAESAARILRREFAGVDIRYCGNKPVILEVNRRPMFGNFEAVTGMDIATCFLKYVMTKVVSGAKMQLKKAI